LEKIKREVVKQITITADLIRDDEGGYRIWCPELDIYARGDDLERAFENLEEAIRNFVDEIETRNYLH
jgi:predicted RNase H-like HicB family nuclease